MGPRVLVLLLLGCALPFSAQAQDPLESCLSTWKQATAGKFANAQSAQAEYQECLARANEQKKVDYAATRNVWADSLDRLPQGGGH